MMRFLIPARLLTVVCLFLTFGALMGAVTDTAAGTTPWAVIKCKFSDQPQEPAFDPLFITGAYGMAAYWSGVSYGHISLSGTTVYGWYTLPYTLAQGMTMSRQQKIDACIAVATANGVNVSQFYSVIAILNSQIDSGSSGGRVLLDPAAWFVSFAAHEMGHGYNLDHSFDDTTVVYDSNSDSRPGAYGDGWDIMSAMNFGGANPTFVGQFGQSGPGLNAPNLDKLGWMDANRVLTWNGASQNAILAALNHPEASGYLMAKVPFDTVNPNHYYTVEFRRKTDWDQGIPQDAVLIHEVRTDGLFYLIKANGGPERLSGQTFRDVSNNVAITVLNIDSASSTATVNIARDEVWVDFGYAGSENGTFAFPFNTLAEGTNAVSYGGTLNFKTGSSAATATISKPMTLKAYNGPVTIGQ